MINTRTEDEDSAFGLNLTRVPFGYAIVFYFYFVLFFIQHKNRFIRRDIMATRKKHIINANYKF